MVSDVLIEKTTLFAGESIRGQNISDRTLTLRLYITTISDLPFIKKGSYTPNYETIFSFTIEKSLEIGKFEVEYPRSFPPTISTPHIKTRCSLLIGRPKFGGRILLPRKELRIKVLPSYDLGHGNIEDIQLERLTFEPGEDITGKIIVKNVENLSSVGILIQQWCKKGGEEISDEHILSDGVFDEETGKIAIKLPPDVSRVKDPFLFYPYSFNASGKDVQFGIRAYVLVHKDNKSIQKEVAIVPKKPVFSVEKTSK